MIVSGELVRIKILLLYHFLLKFLKLLHIGLVVGAALAEALGIHVILDNIGLGQHILNLTADVLHLVEIQLPRLRVVHL